MAVARTIAEGRALIAAVVSRYKTNADQYIRSGSAYNETEARTQLINAFLQSLGWDVLNEKGVTQDAQEVIQEATVEDKAERLSRKPDYEMRLARQRKFYVEAKKPSVNIEVDKAPAFQTRRYGFSAGMPVSLLTNFHRLTIYDCTRPPNETDDPRVAREPNGLYTFAELESRFDELWAFFSREAVYSGAFDEKYKVDPHHQGASQFDEFFLAQVKRWRELLAADIHARNPNVTGEELTYIVQRLLNRIVFLRICEDRELEKYETLRRMPKPQTYAGLKQLLKQADRKYNSGIFDFMNDPSYGVEIGDDTLMSIIDELYYPQSPYTFAVVDPAVLGDIYELFIAQEIVVGGTGQLSIVEKPEVKASGGVATTPQYVVDQIVDRTLLPKISAKSPTQLKDLAVADIACGSGVFLLQVLQRLFDHYLNWYISDGARKHSDIIYEAGKDQWRLRLHEKRRILLAHVFGVDIDPQAVEVAKFSLLLKLIENETVESITVHQARFRERALPSLDKHVVCGNSLVDPARFAQFMPDVSEQLLLKVNPLDWNREFSGLVSGGKFDVIVGNPPYIRIQNMVGYSPEEARFYQSQTSGYQCAQSDNFDKYSLFLERGLNLLQPGGRLGYILPHKFFTIRSGECLRDIIAKGRSLDQIVYFGVQQVFSRSSTYTCILVLDKAPHDVFTLEDVRNLKKWRYGEPGAVVEHKTDEIGSGLWSFVPDDAKLLFANIKGRCSKTFNELAEIFVGVQTSLDNVYIIKPTAVTARTAKFTDRDGKPWTIERALLRPSLLDVPLDAFSKPTPNTFIIFPYELSSGKAILYTPRQMESQFPLAWAYLRAHKPSLKRRSIQSGTPRTWYRYGRSQSLTKFDSPKLILPVLSTEPRCAYDDADIVVTGGGNGPYYLVRPRVGVELSVFFLQAILSHPVMEAMIRSSSSVFRGGYYSHGKQFIKGLPVPDINLNNPQQKQMHDRIVEAATKLLANSESRKAAKTPRAQKVFDRQRVVLLDHLRGMVNALYAITPGDIEIAQSVQIPGGETT